MHPQKRPSWGEGQRLTVRAEGLQGLLEGRLFQVPTLLVGHTGREGAGY